MTDREALKCWEVLERECVADASPYLKLHREKVRLGDGRVVDDFFTLEEPDFAVVFALTRGGEAIGIWHYKHGPGRINLGLPAGYVKDGEEPLAAAQRELLEETGYRAPTWRHLGSFSVHGNRGCGKAHVFLAEGAEKTAEPSADDLEEIRVELIPRAALWEHIRKGDVATLGAAAGMALGMAGYRDTEE
ncbi:MAG TPA: NUDIX hydrolase [Methanomicrobiales archaeon]|nr:NUDIX hydrolase [Methanomicrobiales archaeon]